MEELRDCRSYLNYLEDPLNQDALEMRTIFVHPEEREKGIGTELLKALIKKAEEKGYSKITTYSSTDPEKEPFGAFLVANGFSSTTGQSNYGGCWELKIDAYPIRVETKRKRGVGKLLGVKKPSSQRVGSKRVRRKKV